MTKISLPRFRPVRQILDRLTSRGGETSPAVAPGPVRKLTPRPAAAPVGRDPSEHLSIPVRMDAPDMQVCLDVKAQGQHLARQDRWSELCHEIRIADQGRKTTPGGLPISELLAYGARSDVVNCVEQALQDGCHGESRPMCSGVQEMEEIAEDLPDNPYLNLVLALTHIDVGWIWRGTGSDPAVPETSRQRSAMHFNRAQALLAPFNSIELDSPALAAARCALLAGQRDPNIALADEFEDLIDLDPRNPRHMRALGYHMLPRWFGSPAELDLEARRTAARTFDIWGNGGYTWVCFDAIAIDDTACANVDPEFFADGLRDIVARRPDQETINLLAAYCSVAMRRSLGQSTESDLTRLQIIDCADWLIRDHLTEVHPLVWAHATDGFDQTTRVRAIGQFQARGRDQALSTIADLFSSDIASGYRVTFTQQGAQLVPS